MLRTPYSDVGTFNAVSSVAPATATTTTAPFDTRTHAGYCRDTS